MKTLTATLVLVSDYSQSCHAGGIYNCVLSSSQRCKYKEERLGQEVLREERLNRRTRLFKADVCWTAGRREKVVRALI